MTTMCPLKTVMLQRGELVKIKRNQTMCPMMLPWVKLLKIPRPYLYAGILLFASLGSYAVNADPFDLLLLTVLGLLGLVMRRYGWPIAPAVIGLILGPVAETNLRRALAISDGDLGVLLETTVSKVVLLAALAAVLVPPLLRLRARRRGPAAVDDRVPEDSRV